MILSLSLLACARGELYLNQKLLDWGEVNFHDEACMDCACEEHCGPQMVNLENVGDAPLAVSIPQGLDADHLCLAGFEDIDEAIELPTLDPGDTYLLEVSVCGYLPGEQTLNISGAFQIATDGIPEYETVAWSFTPVRDQPDAESAGAGR